MNQNTSLVTGELYHIYSKSIYGYRIFNRPEDYQRMLMLMRYYPSNPHRSFCHFLKSPHTKELGFASHLKQMLGKKERTVELIAYCIMPTHVHFILKQVTEHGISRFINKVFGGYSMYFNLLHNRRGPLWQSRFGRRHIKDMGDLLNTSHYIHANPVKDIGMLSPLDWTYSSYSEYCGFIVSEERLCSWQETIPLTSQDYQESMTQYLFKRVG